MVFAWSIRRCYATAGLSPYDILKIPRNASLDSIKKSYYKLAKDLHPDTPGGDLEKFKELVKAYEFLSDTAQRTVYRRTGNGWESSHGPRTAASGSAYRSAGTASYPNAHSSTHANDTRRLYLMTFVSGVSVVAGVLALCYLPSQGTYLSAANKHHAQTSRDLAKARTGAQMFGHQRAIKRIQQQQQQQQHQQQHQEEKKVAKDKDK
ncbi:DnaJ domain-containing protein [Spinellus fusiger]|nr:DnaJ domain-containing protein [Spinellus fusiger]